MATQRLRGGSPRITPYAQERPVGGDAQTHVMDEDWGTAYEGSPWWGATWQCTQNPEEAWPRGYRVWSRKMYYEDTLCIPEAMSIRVVAAFY